MNSPRPILLPLLLLGGCAGEILDDATPSLPPQATAEPPSTVDDEPAADEFTRQVAFQIPGRDLRVEPPEVASMTLFPATDEAGRPAARLEVRYAEPLPPTIEFLDETIVRVLADDGRGPDRVAGDGTYSVLVPLPAPMITASGRAAGELAAKLALLPRDGSQGLDLPLPRASSEVAENDPFGIDPARSLLLNDLSVVNNPVRTHDPCQGQSGAATKKWTFGYLMTQMANSTKTGKSASEFATAWMKEWSAKSKTINGEVVKPQNTKDDVTWVRRPIAAEALRQWRCSSGAAACCKWIPLDSTGNFDEASTPWKSCLADAAKFPLHMQKAPFRLTAIVNRIDLRNNIMFGEGKAGELRFVFGVVDRDVRERDANGVDMPTCNGMVMPSANRGLVPEFRGLNHPGYSTVILEYAVDKSTSSAVLAYANDWLALSKLTLDSGAYRDKLQLITESVVKAGVSSSRANNSALIRIRTNESSDNNLWQFREFAIDSTTHLPKSVTTKQSPAMVYNKHTMFSPSGGKEKDLAAWINANEAKIIAGTYKLPDVNPATGLKFLGGQSFNEMTFGMIPSTDPSNADTPIGIKNPLARHLFALNTCGGCHGAETATQFAHVNPRLSYSSALLSDFLTGETVCDPTDQQCQHPEMNHTFKELFRRKGDLASLLASGSAATIAFRPSQRVH